MAFFALSLAGSWWDAALQEGSHKSKVEGENHLSRPGSHTCFDAAKGYGRTFWANSAGSFQASHLSTPTSQECSQSNFLPSLYLYLELLQTHVQDLTL